MKSEFQNIALNDTECMIMRHIKGYIEKNQKVSIKVIATECFVSTAYIMKFAKKIGYSGYSEMYYALLSKEDTSVKVNFENFGKLTSSEINEEIERVCDLLYKHRDAQMIVTSMGFCDHAATYFLHKLWTFGFYAMNTYHIEAYEHEERKPGIVFAFSSSGTMGGIIGRCNYAKKKGYQVVTITSNQKSPLAMVADLSIEILCSKGKRNKYEPDFFSAKILVFLELVLSTYSKKYLIHPKK